MLIGSLIFPVCLLLAYEAVLDEQVHQVTGVASVYGLVPMCAVLSALLGALSASTSIVVDREFGLLGGMWVLPIHRASMLTGRLTAEAVRTLIGTVLITALGVTMGLRFTHGWPTALVFILIPSIVAVGFMALIMAVTIRPSGRTAMTWLTGGLMPLAFVNPGTTPIGLFPRLASAIGPRATDVATHRDDAGTGPRRPPRNACGDDSHLGDRAARGVHSAGRARLSDRRRVQRLRVASAPLSAPRVIDTTTWGS